MKARLVIRGFEEDEKGPVDSPTASKPSMKIFFAVCANNNWVCETMDIKAAFLQGKEIERGIYVKLPAEAKKEGIIWKLNKVAYGLCDASRQWYSSVKEELCKLGCKQSQLNKALFRLNGMLTVILKVHLSCMLMIFLYAGTVNFKKIVITKIQGKVRVGKHMEGNFAN